MKTHVRRFHPLPLRPTERLAVSIGLIVVVAATLTRIAIAMRLESIDAGTAIGDILRAFLSGLIYDVAVAIILVVPLMLFVDVFSRLWKWRLVRYLLHALIIGGLIAIIFGAVAEVFFWEEFSSRFNGISIYYLMFPREVIGNIRESFPLELYLPPVYLAGLLAWWMLRRTVILSLAETRSRGHRWKSLAKSVAAFALAAALIWIAPKSVSENRELRQLGHNGLVMMAEAALFNYAEYDGVYAGLPEGEAHSLLREAVAQDNTTFLEPETSSSILRRVNNGDQPKKLNIVMVTEETFGSIFVDDLDSTHSGDLTPNLTRMGKEGMYFTNIYASGQRTVRGLEATETAFAPIPGISTARRAQSSGMYSLPFLLKKFGYTSGLLYGGIALFDNMRTFWEGIGFDHVWDQSDVRHDAFTTIWGVSDEDLFTEALQRMDENAKKDQPFLLTLMTVSNHRPYKFPETHVKWNSAWGKQENTVFYADWAFSNFIDRARGHPWFDDTVFIFVADHSRKVNGAADIPLQSFRIPMLFYAPKHIAPARIETLGAQIDLIPTLLGQLGISYNSPFFGVDLMRVPKGKGRIAVAHNFSVGYARPGHAVVLDPDGTVKGYAFQPGTTPLVPEAPDLETTRLAIAQTQTAHRMFYSRQYHEHPQGWPRGPQASAP